ncbi:MAG TPA: hypothetical protein VHH53_14590 [Pseudonocardiaceae bacterium]|nr:hypothetical protein [Pseudonocardiaceae bacterium]
MSEAPSCTELDGQHVELLRTCTVLSLFSAASGGRGGNGGAVAPGGVGKGRARPQPHQHQLGRGTDQHAGNGWCCQGGGSIGGAGGPAVS